MQSVEKNTKDGNTPLKIHFSNTKARVGTTAPSSMPTRNTLDFHLEMIKKIDTLLDEHEKDPVAAPAFHEPPIIPPQPPTPIEPRPPLNKAFSHEEIAWRQPMESSRTRTQTMPEEFKTELSGIPEFRFITSHEFLETISQEPVLGADRVEVIDLSELSGEMPSSHQAINLITMKNKNDLSSVSTLLKDDVDTEDHPNKKIEVIDVHTFKEHTHTMTADAADSPADQSEKKSKLFFRNRKDDDEKKQKNQEVEHTYLPDDIEERLKALKEKKKKEEEQRRLQEEKERKERQTEDEALNEETEPRQTREEKKLAALLDEEETYDDFEPPQTKKTPFEKEPPLSKDLSLKNTAQELKEQLKEQKRQQQLAIRKARVEQRQRKKKEKEMLKLQRKQELLEQKQNQKTEPKGFPLSREKKQAEKKHEETKEETSEELDEDIRKVLV
ncbi:MAG: cell envelope integrity protein TolA, partial [Candidatus Thermoplasmatota archaeon]|nr:cell envelope integrity protein TolA [Candidatus Thermoplasmatota archaeon]